MQRILTRLLIPALAQRQHCALIRILWHDGVGMSFYMKRLEAGKFIWPVSQNGSAVPVSSAQLGYLLEGIDRRNPRWTQRPSKAG